MNKLNVFNNHYYNWRYPSCWKKNIRIFFNSISAAYQRVTRGFCWWDIWDFDSHLSELIAQGLETLANEGYGYPGNDEFPTPESWHDYLHEIARLFRFYLNEQPNEYEEAWRGTWDSKYDNRTVEEQEIINNYLEKERENSFKQQEAAQTALNMLGHIWGDLWD